MWDIRFQCSVSQDLEGAVRTRLSYVDHPPWYSECFFFAQTDELLIVLSVARLHIGFPKSLPPHRFMNSP